MKRGMQWQKSRGGRWIGIGCAAAWVTASIVFGQGGAAPHAAHGVAAAVPAEAAPAPGAAQYGQYCAVCHQANGQGMPGSFPPLKDDPIVKGDPHYLARVVLYGLQGRIEVNGHPYTSPMAGFAAKMNDMQVADLLTYIRSSWGNNAPEISADVVKAERAVPGTPQDNGAKYPK